MRKSAQLDVMVVPQTISFCYKILQKCRLAQIKCCPDQLVLHTYLYMYYECMYMTLHIFFFISCFILDYINQPLDSFILREEKGNMKYMCFFDTYKCVSLLTCYSQDGLEI